MQKNKIGLIIAWIFQVVVIVILLKPVMTKFTAAPDVVAMFSRIGMEPHGRIIIGILELIVIILMLLPHSGVYGAFLGLGIMTGAIIGHFTSIGIEGLPMALLVFLCCLIILYFRRHESSIFKNMF